MKRIGILVFAMATLLASQASAFDLSNLGNSIGNAVNSAVDTATSQPDIVVDDVRFWTSVGPISISLKNQGDGIAVGALSAKVEWLRADGSVQSESLFACAPALLAHTTGACLPTLIIPNVPRVRVTANPSGLLHVPESDENNNAREFDVPPPPQPDLVITNVDINPDTRIPAVTVKNQGSMPVPGGLVGWDVSLLDASSRHLTVDEAARFGPLCTGLSEQVALNPDASVVCFGSPLTNKVKKYKITVNPARPAGVHLIQESNFDNNTVEVTTPPPQLPDLVITDITINPDTRIPVVTIKNQGTGKVIGAGALLGFSRMMYDSAGNSLDLERLASTAPLCLNVGEQLVFNPGQTMTCAAPPLPNTVAGYKVTVNPVGIKRLHAIGESEYGNNSLQVDVPAPKVPDFVITGISINEDTRIPVVTIKNQGTGNAFMTGALIGWKTVFIDASGKSLDLDKALSVAPLCTGLENQITFAPGASMNCTGTPLSNKVTKYKVTVNPVQPGNVDVLNELNHKNNTFEVVVPAPKVADFVITGIAIDPDTRIPKVTIKNQGTAAAIAGGLALNWKTVLIDAKGKSLDLEKALNISTGCDNVATNISFNVGDSTVCSFLPLTNKVARFKMTVNPATKIIKKVSVYGLEELNYANNTLEVQVPAPKLPDLSLEAIKLDEYGGPHMFTVKNVGTKDYVGDAIHFTVKITAANGFELPALPNGTPLSMLCMLPGEHGGLAMGEAKQCEAKFSMGSAAAKLKVTLAAIRTGWITLYQGEEISITNNSLTVDVPPQKFPDLALQSITFGDDGLPVLTVKNVGTRIYTSGAVGVAATATTGAGREVPVTSNSLAAQMCAFEGEGQDMLKIDQVRTCKLPLQFSSDAKRLRISLAAIKVGGMTKFLGEELSTKNNTLTVNIPVRGMPDLSLESITFGADKMSVLGIKNVGTKTYTKDTVSFAIIAKDSMGHELPVGTNTVTPNLCLLAKELAIGETQYCVTNALLGNDAKRLTVSLAAVRVGTVTNFVGEELSTENNTKTVDVPLLSDQLPDLALTAIGWEEGDVTMLRVKNVGTKEYLGGALPFIATVTDVNGSEIPSASASVAATACMFVDPAWLTPLPIPVNGTRDCIVGLVRSDAAKTLSITIGALKVGQDVRMVTAELSIENNSKSVAITKGVKGAFPSILDEVTVTCPETISPNQTVHCDASNVNPQTGAMEAVAGTWGISAVEGGKITSAGNYTAPFANGEKTIIFTFAGHDDGRPKQVLKKVWVGPKPNPVAQQEPTPTPVAGYRIDGPTSVQSGKVITLKAMLTDANGNSTQQTSGIWSAHGLGGSITQDGVYTGAPVVGHETITYTYTDEESNWKEVSLSVLVEPSLSM